MGAALFIQVFKQGQLVSGYRLESAERKRIVKIGSLATADIALGDLSVARLHAVLEVTPDRVQIRNMASQGGVTVNGVAVAKAILTGENRIDIGPYQLLISPLAASAVHPRAMPVPVQSRGSVVPAEDTAVVAGQLRALPAAELARLQRALLAAHARPSAPSAPPPAPTRAPQAVAPAPAARRTAGPRRPAPPPSREKYDTRLLLARMQRQRRRHTGLTVAGATALIAFLALPVVLLRAGRVESAALQHRVESPQEDLRVVQPEPIPAEQPENAAIEKSERAEPVRYTVAAGDTLGTIAEKTLGHSRHWQAIFEANRGQLADPSALEIGMSLSIPNPLPNPAVVR